MAKKNTIPLDFTPEPVKDNKTETESVEAAFETEAYIAPEADPGADVTVMKPVGKGGPVPIVSPKHDTIQLQPIIVPLAVVPYMTQDSGMLRTDNAAEAGYRRQYADYAEPLSFEPVAAEKKTVKKKSGGRNRVFGLMVLLLSACTVLPFILSYFYDKVGTAVISQLDVVGQIIAWVEGSAPSDMVTVLLYALGAGVAALMFLTAFIVVLSGKYPRIFVLFSSIFSAAPLLAVLLYQIVKNTFDAAYSGALVFVCAVSALNFILSIAFAIAAAKGREEQNDFRDSEI
jgi:hypothetical protein